MHIIYIYIYIYVLDVISLLCVLYTQWYKPGNLLSHMALSHYSRNKKVPQAISCVIFSPQGWSATVSHDGHQVSCFIRQSPSPRIAHQVLVALELGTSGCQHIYVVHIYLWYTYSSISIYDILHYITYIYIYAHVTHSRIYTYIHFPYDYIYL